MKKCSTSLLATDLQIICDSTSAISPDCYSKRCSFSLFLYNKCSHLKKSESIFVPYNLKELHCRSTSLTDHSIPFPGRLLTCMCVLTYIPTYEQGDKGGMSQNRTWWRGDWKGWPVPQDNTLPQTATDSGFVLRRLWASESPWWTIGNWDCWIPPAEFLMQQVQIRTLCICISDKFSGDADVAGLGTTLRAKSFKEWEAKTVKPRRLGMN